MSNENPYIPGADDVQVYQEPEGFQPPTLTGDPDFHAASGQQDYFGFGGTTRHMLPDGVSFVELKIMAEGDRRKYLNSTSRSVKFSKGEQMMDMKLGEDTRALLLQAIVGWNIVRGGAPLHFNRANLEKFLDAIDPRIVNAIEKAIRVNNPWLLSDMTVEQIDKEIEDLMELRRVVEQENEGKAV